MVKIAVLYLAAMNIITFAAMGIDKYKAQKRLRRISEKKLFVFAGIGGSLGGIIGMKLFHHKTRHRRFTIGLPVILFLQGAAVFLSINNFS